MEIDLTKVDVNKIGGSDWPEPGTYHFEVLEFMENDPRYNDGSWFDAEVLSGTVKDQEGKTHREFLNSRTAIEIAVALKLTTKEEIARYQAAGRNLEVDFDQAVGRQFVGGLQPETYEGKTRNKLSFRVWAVDSSQAKGVPLNAGKLKEFEALLAGGNVDPFADPTEASGPATGPAGGNGGAAPPAAGDLADDLF